MKIAALADIHGNLPALEAVLDHLAAWKPDRVYVLGDIVNRGPRSVECLAVIRSRVRENGWNVIRGNHENYVLAFDQPSAPQEGPRAEILQYVRWTYQSLSREDLAVLNNLPEQIAFHLPNGQLTHVLHGSHAGLRKGIYPETSVERMGELIQPGPVLVLVGHTHRPLIRKMGNTTIINAGSVGLPFDSDPRTGYAQIVQEGDETVPSVVRIPYDRDRALRDFQRTGFSREGGPMTDIIRKELEISRSLLSRWNKRYYHAVLEGILPLPEAVEKFLAEAGR